MHRLSLLSLLALAAATARAEDLDRALGAIMVAWREELVAPPPASSSPSLGMSSSPPSSGSPIGFMPPYVPTVLACAARLAARTS